jgi:hypothetical protein
LLNLGAGRLFLPTLWFLLSIHIALSSRQFHARSIREPARRALGLAAQWQQHASIFTLVRVGSLTLRWINDAGADQELRPWLLSFGVIGVLIATQERGRCLRSVKEDGAGSPMVPEPRTSPGATPCLTAISKSEPRTPNGKPRR